MGRGRSFARVPVVSAVGFDRIRMAARFGVGERVRERHLNGPSAGTLHSLDALQGPPSRAPNAGPELWSCPGLVDTGAAVRSFVIRCVSQKPTSGRDPAFWGTHACR